MTVTANSQVAQKHKTATIQIIQRYFCFGEWNSSLMQDSVVKYISERGPLIEHMSC